MSRKKVPIRPASPAAVETYPGTSGEVLASPAAAAYRGTACIIACHNYGRFLEQCIASCLRQTLPFESIVVVDDASSDDTAAVAGQFQKDGVRYLRGEWRNYSEARMAGLAASPRTPYLLFVDADNALSPDYHEKLNAGMTQPNLGAVYGDLLRFNADAVLGISPQVRSFDAGELRSRNFADACSLVRREAFEQVGGWKSDSFLTDWMLWLDLTRHGWTMRHAPEAVLHYRVHEAQMSNARFGNWDIHVAPLRQSCMIALVTLFSGRQWALNRYFDWLSRLDWQRGNVHLVALDNSNDPAFSAALKAHLAKTDVAFSYVPEPSRALPEVAAAEMAGSRVHRTGNAYALAAHLAKLYAVARQHIPSGADFVWSVEDDIEPPADALHHLCKGLFRYPRAGAVTGCARSRFEDQWILWRENQPVAELPAPGEYARVDATGFYCILLRRPTFDQIAFRPTRDWSLKHCAYDWAAMQDLTQAGREVLAAGSVRCRHWQQDGTYL